MSATQLAFGPALKPQTAAVLEMLREHPEGVTPLQALHGAGTFRLAARVWELRKAGHVISVKNVGDGVFVYRLER